ncbi:hypothetical protein MKEN_00185600 [Mycena kentingensis (nom. inval.)]|nr:hypothetical protein MKEN_00185600 [Mycena kentingensis (nom. inval.)]
MHDALQIDEVLVEIFSHLIPDPESDYVYRFDRRWYWTAQMNGQNKPDRNHRQDLNAVVRTCRAFLEPGLSALWQSQYGLTNILKLLPADAWEEFEDQVEGRLGLAKVTGLRILRAITDDEWQKPIQFAQRVRRLHVEPKDKAGLAGISEYFPRSQLFFTRLERLWWRSGNASFLDINPFLSLSVVELDLLISSAPKEEDVDAARRLCIMLANVRHLELDVRIPVDDPRSSAVTRVITDPLRRLETFTAPVLGRTILDHISRIPTIRDIQLTGTDLFTHPRNYAEWDIPASAAPQETPVSGSLQHLSLGVGVGSTSFPLFINLLETSPVWSFKTISVISMELETHQTIRRMYTMLSARQSLENLEVLHVGYFDDRGCCPEPPEDAPLEDYVVSADTLRVLFCFSNLRSIMLSSSAGFALDDDDVRAIASTWRNATELVLSSASEYTAPAGPALTGAAFVKITRYCKRLKMLELPMMVTEVPELESIPHIDQIAQNALMELNVCEARIYDPEAVALLLSTLFPQLSGVQTSTRWEILFDDEDGDNEDFDDEDDEFSCYEDWREVSNILRTASFLR